VGILVLDQHGGTFFATTKAEFNAALVLQYTSWYQVTYGTIETESYFQTIAPTQVRYWMMPFSFVGAG